MQLKTLKGIDIKGKTVLYRVAYDIGPKEESGVLVVKDLARIIPTLPTLLYLIEQQSKVVLLTWVKRPGGKVDPKLSTRPHAVALATLIGKPVGFVSDCVGPEVEKAIANMQVGGLLMLENVRFHPEEEENNPAFAHQLIKGIDLIVFDAFAQAHRVHASTTGILEAGIPAVAGFLMEKEVSLFDRILRSPERPLVAILGGAKISDKVETIKFLLNQVDVMLIGGALANTFLKGLGKPVGASMVESSVVNAGQKGVDYLAVASMLFRTAPRIDMALGLPVEAVRKLVLPVDLVAAASVEPEAETKIFDVDNHNDIPDTWKYLDIGPRTVEFYSRIIRRARTIFWNGPMGYFEIDTFAEGTRWLAEDVIHSDAFSILAGGDTETMIAKFGLEGKFSHVSTGGGVSLEILAGKELPVLKYLKN